MIKMPIRTFNNALIIDDVASARSIIRRLLTGIGIMDIADASNGSEALEMCRRRPFDLIICDCDMPVLDGLGYLRAMRAKPLRRQPFIIMMSATMNTEQIIAARAAGMNAFLMKPFTAAALMRKMTHTALPLPVIQPREIVYI